MAKENIGVELNEKVVENASCVDKVLTKLFKDNINIDVVVCDPTRTGLGEDVCNTLLNNKFKNIVYVSCNPATLVKGLLSKVYNVKYIQPVDMFLYTSYVETIVLLILK